MPQISEHGEVESVIRAHTGWVHACARRRVGDEAMAQDVTQAVFILFWRKRRRLGETVKLTGWLYRAVRYCAANAVRLKQIRQRHELEAAMNEPQRRPAGEADWSEVSPELEQAVDRLRENERAAVLLRFYRQMSFAEVGQSLGISEEAAQKRVERALEKLRGMLGRSGVGVGARSLGVMLAEKATAAAPAGVVDGVVAAAGNGGTGTVAGVIARGALKMMLWIKVKTVSVGLLIAVVLAGGIGAAVTLEDARISGTLLLPDGRPAAGAAVYQVSKDVHVVDPVAGLSERGPTSRPGAHAPQTGSNGEFAFWGRDVVGVAFAHPDGFRMIGFKDLKQSDRVTLENWARVQGRVSPSLGALPQKVKLMYQPDLISFRYKPEAAAFTYELETAVRPDGTFTFEHVPPGRVSVGRVLEHIRFMSGSFFNDHRIWVSTEPGQAAEAVVGGSGATVKGSVVLEDGEAASSEKFEVYAILSWSAERPSKKELEQVRKAAEDFGEQIDVFHRWKETEGRWYRDYDEREKTHYVAFPDAQGQMIFHDVPAGTYKIRVDVSEFNKGTSWGPGLPVGAGQKDVVVTESGTVDIGAVRVAPRRPVP